MQNSKKITSLTWKKGARVNGLEREEAAEKFKDWYLKDRLSIREIGEKTGRSYGFVHRMLSEAGVVLRGRGGDRRSARRVKSTAEN
ncbi:helix-turn-helix domain-containing protein [Streptomyces sp. NPDC102264]|uniref:helix-turn-helix domain-containing protein n=1 Tax=Streptomyces sp. NPDC102264 TaxID=3366149 RepID=UPI003800F93F